MPDPVAIQPNLQNTLRGVVVINGKLFRKKIREYQCSIDMTAVALATNNNSIQINPTEMPFMLQKIHVNDSLDGNTLTNQQEMFIGAVDNESGYQWTDGQVPRAAFAGDRIFGYTLPEELPIRSNTRVTFTAQNPATAPAGVHTATITLVGYELWPL